MDDSPETKTQKKSCLTDRPLQSKKDDNLNAKDYANALARFIKDADTPVTIGIQGGWGSGKTSLITLLQEMLDTDPDHRTLCVLVNAWEHSLFHSADSKADVALSLLNGLAAGLKKRVKHILDSEDDNWLDNSVEEIISPKNKKIEKAIECITGSLKIFSKVGIQAASNLLGTGDMSHVLKDSEKNTEPMPPLAEHVHELRTGMKEMITKITCHNHPVTVVFFVDDLDRVPPPTAVELLDITKNIFDIPNCVFVLTIDYEVVIKGLEAKFGKKDVKNEREFRQYFDKIIQIPFAMPIGAYGDNLSDMLRSTLENLGYRIGNEDNKLLKSLSEDARLATGGIPRSIKRIVNTLSLLQHIASARTQKAADQDALPKDLEARFIITALHINFPEICGKLMEESNFSTWTLDKLNLKWKLNEEENREELENLARDEYFDEDWEKVVYCLCSQSEWLKSQAFNVSKLLNKLRTTLNNDKNKKNLTEESLETLNNILEGIKVVSIDSDFSTKPQFDDKSVKTDRVTMFFAQLQNELSQRLPKNIMPQRTDEYAKRLDRRCYEVNINDENIFLAQFEWYKNDDPYIIVALYATRYNLSQRKSKPTINDIRGDFEMGIDENSFYYYFSKDFTFDDFSNKNKNYDALLSEVVEKSIDLYNTINKAQKALSKLA